MPLGLINTGLGIFGNLLSHQINNNAQRRLYEQQYRDSLKFYNMQREDNLEMWNMNNEYNSPAEQSARLRAAGLNPDLQNVDSGNSSSPSSIPQANVPEQQYSPLSDMGDFFASLPSIMDIVKQVADIDNVKASTANQMDLLAKSTALRWMTSDSAQNIIDGTSVNILPYQAWQDLPRMSKRKTRDFMNLVDKYYNSPAVAREFMSLEKGYNEDFLKNLETKGNPFFSSPEILSSFLKMKLDTDLSLFSSQQAENNYNTDYYNSLDPSVAAARDNQVNETERTEAMQNEQYKDAAQAFVDWYENAMSEATSGEQGVFVQVLAMMYMASMEQRFPKSNNGSSGFTKLVTKLLTKGKVGK